jgi:hypothetical protein
VNSLVTLVLGFGAMAVVLLAGVGGSLMVLTSLSTPNDQWASQLLIVRLLQGIGLILSAMLCSAIAAGAALIFR